MVRGQKQFRIKWIGFNKPSWEIAAVFENDPAFRELVDDHVERTKAKKRDRKGARGRKKELRGTEGETKTPKTAKPANHWVKSSPID